jgi:hypothetical protein
MAENERITVTHKAKAIYAQYKATTDERQRANLACALHSAVGLFPWSQISVGQVIAEFEHEQPGRKSI